MSAKQVLCNKQVKPRFTTTSRAISFKKLIKNAKKKHFKTINQEINEDNMAKKQKSEPEEPTPLAIATCHSHLAIARLVMANNRKQPKKCHFNLKGQNN